MSTVSLHYEIEISSDTNQVYLTMINDATYKVWTSIFNAASHSIGSWDQVSKILFLGCDAEGNEAGKVRWMFDGEEKI